MFAGQMDPREKELLEKKKKDPSRKPIEVVFVAENASVGRELWTTDGTAAGTVPLDLIPGPSSLAPRLLTGLGNLLVMVADDGSNGPEPWVTDLTVAGTQMLRDILPGAGGSEPSDLRIVGARVFFAATDATAAVTLWSTDGTVLGTVPVLGLGGHAGGGPLSLAAVGSLLYFEWDDGVSGSELWLTDGVTTQRVADINPGAASSYPRYLTAFGNGVLFGADDGGRGLELWRSDGTAAGTQIVRDVTPGAAGSMPDFDGFIFCPPGAQRALFQASDGVRGLELWRTDGTAAGTVLHYEFVNGQYGGVPDQPVLAGSRLFFAAFERTTGIEPWVMASMAAAAPIGVPCGTSPSITPRVAGLGAPFLGNAAFQARVTLAPPSVPAVFMLADRWTPLFLGCDVLILNSVISLSLATDAMGSATVPLPVPNVLSLRGGVLLGQWFVVQIGGPVFNLAAGSEGLRIILADN